jgi:hypothetical protein
MFCACFSDFFDVCAGQFEITRWSIKGFASMDELDEDAIRQELAKLRQEHRDLDSAINALEKTANRDPLQIQRLKKRKLILKDRITILHLEHFAFN